MTESESDHSMIRNLWQTFRYPQPADPPQPDGMTFEQRAVLIGALIGLTDQGNRTIEEWRNELVQVLSWAPATKPLSLAAKRLGGGEGPQKSDVPRLRQIARSGLTIAENHPVSAFGGDVKYLIAQYVDSALARNSYVRLARWLIPLIFALLFGGVIWGTFKVEGINKAASDASTSISSASEKITNLSNSIQQAWQNELQEETASQLEDLENEVSLAKVEVDTKVADDVKTVIPKYEIDQENSFHAQLFSELPSETQISDALAQDEKPLLTLLGTQNQSIQNAINERNDLQQDLESSVADSEKMEAKLQSNIENLSSINSEWQNVQASIEQLSTANNQVVKIFFYTLLWKDIAVCLALVMSLISLIIALLSIALLRKQPSM